MSRGRLAWGALLALALVPAGPAGAHAGPGGRSAPATNDRTLATSVSPTVPGLRVRPVEAGDRLELVNQGVGGEDQRGGPATAG